MIKIKIPKLCSCAKKKNSWTKKQQFETLEEAVKKAKKMCKKANQDFCKKHRFEYKVEDKNVTILTIASK